MTRSDLKPRHLLEYAAHLPPSRCTDFHFFSPLFEGKYDLVDIIQALDTTYSYHSHVVCPTRCRDWLCVCNKNDHAFRRRFDHETHFGFAWRLGGIPMPLPSK